MELIQPSSCIFVFIWMCFTSANSVKNISFGNTQEFVPSEPVPTTSGINSNFTSAYPFSEPNKTHFKSEANKQKTLRLKKNDTKGYIINRSIKNVNPKELTNKSNTSVDSSHNNHKIALPIRDLSPPATAERLKSTTSLAGTLVLLLISVVIAGALLIMVICFIHKWRENMGNGEYPRVVYSMLRQSEDEPEDVLGEILINIGLATPGDAHPLTPPSSSSSSRCSPTPADAEMELDDDLEGTEFTAISLKSDDTDKRIIAPDREESDEELLQ